MFPNNLAMQSCFVVLHRAMIVRLTWMALFPFTYHHFVPALLNIEQQIYTKTWLGRGMHERTCVAHDGAIPSCEIDCGVKQVLL